MTKPRMFRPRRSSWRAVAAMSSCNVLPVTIEISPINAGFCVRQSSCTVPGNALGTLQDDCLAQDPAFVGLISMITGCTLQEDIAATARQMLIRGRNILGFVIPETTQTTALPPSS